MLIVIEGIDGSGKSTQASKLATSLTSLGLSVGTLRFPRYDVTRGGELVGDFLDGKFGKILSDLHPKLVSLPYMIDRYESKSWLEANMMVHDVVVIDRFVASNAAHQVAKLPKDDWDEFIVWVATMEFCVFKLPTPNLTIEFKLPVEQAAKLIAKKKKRSYTDAEFDLHEADMDYQRQVAQGYREADFSGEFSEEWCVFDVDRNGHLRDENELAAAVFAKVKETLSRKGVKLDG